MAFSKLHQQSTSETKMELLAAQARITELSRELSEARRRSPSSESTVTSSSFWPTGADPPGVEDLIRELRQCQEERATALEEASSACSEAQLAQEQFHAEKLQHEVLREELSELAAWRYPASQLTSPVEMQEDPATSHEVTLLKAQIAEEAAEFAKVQNLYKSELQEALSSLAKVQVELKEAQRAAEASSQVEVRKADGSCAEILALRAELCSAQEEARKANARAAAASKAWGR